MNVEEARAMPGAFTAYRRTDGELVYGEYAWVAEHFECDEDAGDDPIEIEEVVMVPIRVRFFPCHHQPRVCSVCGEDAEEGPIGSDGLPWCADCYAEGEPASGAPLAEQAAPS